MALLCFDRHLEYFCIRPAGWDRGRRVPVRLPILPPPLLALLPPRPSPDSEVSLMELYGYQPGDIDLLYSA